MPLDRRYLLWDLLLLVVLAGLLRLQGLSELSLTEAEAENATAARSFLETGRFSPPGAPPPFQGRTYKALTAIGFQFFGESEWIARAPSACFGILTTLWLYLWGSHWFGAWTGRTAAFLYAVWPWTVAWGRMGRFEGLHQFLYLLLVISVWKMLEGNLLGHPVADPPTTAGRRNGLAKIAWHAGPFLILVVLSLLTSATTILAVAVLPLYLLIRLAWCWTRTKNLDCEFKRSLRYFLAGCLIALGSGGLTAMLNPGLWELGRGLLQLPMDPGYYTGSFATRFGLIFLGGLLAGTILALKMRRGGWLTAAAAWAPILMHTFLVPFYRDRFIYDSFPFVLLLAGLPAGLALDRLSASFSHFFGTRQKPCWKDALAISLLGLAAVCVGQNVLWGSGSTAALVNHAPAGEANAAANWKEIASVVRKQGSPGLVITTDPFRALYYLGRVDYLYPFLENNSEGPRHRSGAIPLPDASAFHEVTGTTAGEVWIVGTRSRFEQVAGTLEALHLWRDLLQQSQDVWRGLEEIAIHLPGGKQAVMGKTEGPSAG